MARSTDRKRGVAASSGAALAAVMLAAPGFASLPAPAEQAGPAATAENSARSGIYMKYPNSARALNFAKIKVEYKHKGEYAIAGVSAGRVVFEDERGNLFYVDEATGDQKFVTRKVFSKVELQRDRKHDTWIKLSGKVTILGVDHGGRAIMTGTKGEKFYLDPVTGDMMFVK